MWCILWVQKKVWNSEHKTVSSNGKAWIGQSRRHLNVLFDTVYMFNNGEGKGNPVQYSCLENPMDRGAW